MGCVVAPGGDSERKGRLLLDRVSRLLDASISVKYEVTDEPGSLSLAAIASPFILDLAEMTRVCLNDVQDYFGAVDLAEDESADNEEEFSLDNIGALISSEIAIQEVHDLAFVANSQLRLSAERLRGAINDQNLLAMVNGSEVVLTRLRRGLLPIEIALSKFTEVELPERTIGDLRGSLTIRRQYARLRREIIAIDTPSDEQLEDLLTEFSSRLSSLRSGPHATQVRINDRVQMTAIIKRINAWKSKEPPLDIEIGRNIWGDLTTFASLLALTNNRQELIEHDQRIIAKVFHELYANVRPPKTISETILADLQTLEGRDDDLDLLILHSVSRRPSDWEAPLRRLWLDLDQPVVESRLTRLER